MSVMNPESRVAGVRSPCVIESSYVAIITIGQSGSLLGNDNSGHGCESEEEEVC